MTPVYCLDIRKMFKLSGQQLNGKVIEGWTTLSMAHT